MKRFFFLRIFGAMLLVSGLLAACSPVPYYFNVNQRTGSQTAYDVSASSVAVLGMYDPRQKDSAAIAALATGFAQELEALQYRPEGSLPVYTFASDTLLPGDVGYQPYLLPEDAADYLVVLDALKLGTYSLDAGQVYLPFSCRLLLFQQQDGQLLLNQSVQDSLVWTFLHDFETSDAKLISLAHSTLDQVLAKLGSDMTALVAGSSYSKEQLLYVMENDPDWIRALEHAVHHQWEQAADIWMEKAQHARSWKVRVAAGCNLSVACRYTGNRALAEQWMDWASGIGSLPEMGVLRTQLKQDPATGR